MKKTTLTVLVLFSVLALTSFAAHKFYMGIYQINYASDKKMLQITSRIFLDDINKALEKKYQISTHLGTPKETPQEVALLQKYLSEKLVIKVNGVAQPMHFLNKEVASDVLVCYLSIKDLRKIKSLEVYNAVLMDLESEQQNIVHFTGFGDKQSHLFTASNARQMLKL
ncbi:DUF6702 family protein [Flavobacterium crassostreae]|uniref:Peptidase E n=1 Tax=Flavobacterium crassostreae TaxID=1763534 RepID=A0A1B9DXP0_9FLAO|nr:DUF6702 family protein [Flavobacterium crassostreae]OCB74461.1 hypothetical protein LPBF_10755 [Flavobacterium crassostreae]